MEEEEDLNLFVADAVVALAKSSGMALAEMG